MEIVQKQIRRANRRLTTQLALRTMGQSLLVLWSLAALSILAIKIWPIGVDERVWLLGWLLGATVLALLVTMIVTIWRRPSMMYAAIEIDRRFGLKERISSASEMTGVERASPAVQALIHDAVSRAERIDVRDAFPFGFQRQQAWILVPLMLAIGGSYLPAWVVTPEPETELASKLDITQVKNSTQPIIEQLRKKREAAESEGLTAEADMFRQLEDRLKDLQQSEKLDSKEAMAKLNDIKQELQERQKQLGSGASLQKNLQQNLKKMESGPAEKMADALQEGDFDKAEEELKKMMDKLASGEMTPQEKQKMAEQFKSLEKALEESIQQQKQAKQMLEKQLQQAQQAGDSQKAAQLQKQLDGMESAESQMEKLASLQQTLQEMDQAMQQGDSQAAQEAMDKMLGQIQQMQQDQEQQGQLEDLMDQLMDSKNSMNCKKCNGKGCPFCRGGNSGKPQQGMGMGEGKGTGNRDEEENDVNHYDAQVRDKMRKGETVFKGKVGGANRKGDVKSAVQQAVLAAESDEAKAMEDVVLPKAQREQAKQFFDAMRTGKSGGQ